MTKKELGDRIAERANFYKKDVHELLDTMVDVATEALINGEKISISKFISIEPITIPKRKVRNPREDTYVFQDEHVKIKVRVSDVLKQIVNGEDMEEDDEG